jgi:hypothetical protein
MNINKKTLSYGKLILLAFNLFIINIIAKAIPISFDIVPN